MDDTTPDPESPERRDETADQDRPVSSGTVGHVSTLPPNAGRPIGPPPARATGTYRKTIERPGGATYPFEPSTPPGEVRRVVELTGGDQRHFYPVAAPVRNGRRSSVLVGVVSGVLAAALTVAGLAIGGIFDRPVTIVQQVAVPSQPAQIIVDGNATSTAAAVALKVKVSVVAVEVGSENEDNIFIPFASGSGVILTGDGLIVTNHHVIADADLARVILQDGVIYQARIIGSDPITDLAVLQIDAAGLIPIEVGSTGELAIGDQAVAVGNPLGLPGGASVTVGVISAFDREVTVGSTPDDRLFGMLQTDAPIQAGSSGGALVDARGGLIGITTAIGVSDAGAEGVGFAIPVELVTRITDEIIERGFVRHTFLGVLLQDHFEERNGAQVPEGAVIVEFVDPSGVREAGLEVGDRLTVINGRVVITKEDIINELRNFRVGETLTFEVVRDGTTFGVEVVLGERPGEL